MEAGGQRLAARGEPITPDLVRAARKKGLVDDLILAMTWPEELAGEPASD